ncbi:MAG: DUF255 domain-containing protein [Candidatus Latescibacteria bacterium]|jgi:uncharacterized protein YyaL (SSP411 family)|nr:DUF255 domain-containing protein [Candidatus Latescibacterota bacterium]
MGAHIARHGVECVTRCLTGRLVLAVGLLVGLLVGLSACSDTVQPPDVVVVHDEVSTDPATPYPSDDPSNAAAIEWREWNQASLAEARRLQRPLLLYIATAGADGLFSAEDELVRSLAEERFVPIRIDPWLQPELDRRYGGSWPTLAIVLPGGALMAQAPDISPARVRVFLLRMLAHLQDRPEIVEAEIVLPALERAPLSVEQVLSAAATQFDAVHGGFGRSAKHPEMTLLEFLGNYGTRHEGSEASTMRRRTLDAIVASELWNRIHGPFVYAHTASWRLPRHEIDAAVVAGLLRVFGSDKTAPASDRHAAGQLRATIANTLFDEEHQTFTSRRLPLIDDEWWSDPTLYADRIAYMTWTLYDTDQQITSDLASMRRLAAEGLTSMVSAAGVVQHARGVDGPVGSRGLLRDQLLVSLALSTAGNVEDRPDWSQMGQRTWEWAQESLYDEQVGAFRDCLAPDEMPDWQIYTPFDDDVMPSGNALAALWWLRHGEPERARQLLQRVSHHPIERSRAAAASVLLQLEDGG